MVGQHLRTAGHTLIKSPQLILMCAVLLRGLASVNSFTNLMLCHIIYVYVLLTMLLLHTWDSP